VPNNSQKLPLRSIQDSAAKRAGGTGSLRDRGAAGSCPVSRKEKKTLVRSARRRLTRAEAKAQTRERLLDAAARLFASQGFADTGVEKIAESAGYPVGALYSNFDNKEQLFLELLSTRLSDRISSVAEILDADTGGEDRSRFTRISRIPRAPLPQLPGACGPSAPSDGAKGPQAPPPARRQRGRPPDIPGECRIQGGALPGAQPIRPAAAY